jgi:hypothetical protein
MGSSWKWKKTVEGIDIIVLFLPEKGQENTNPIVEHRKFSMHPKFIIPVIENKPIISAIHVDHHSHRSHHLSGYRDWALAHHQIQPGDHRIDRCGAAAGYRADPL